MHIFFSLNIELRQCFKKILPDSLLVCTHGSENQNRVTVIKLTNKRSIYLTTLLNSTKTDIAKMVLDTLNSQKRKKRKSTEEWKNTAILRKRWKYTRCRNVATQFLNEALSYSIISSYMAYYYMVSLLSNTELTSNCILL